MATGLFSKRRPNFLLLTLDCLRADFLSATSPLVCPSTPNLNAFCSQAHIRTNCRSVSNKTWVAHASVFTGLWPMGHSVRHKRSPLNTTATTLAGTFSAHGYYTAAFPAIQRLRLLNLDVGFQYFDINVIHNLSHWVSDPLEHWERSFAQAISIMQNKNPFFIWLHFFGIHSYQPDQWLRFLRHHNEPIHATHDGEYGQGYAYKVRLADRLVVGPLLDFLRSAGLLDSTYVCIFGDHGDHLTQSEAHHRYEVGTLEEILHVPLMIRGPEIEPRESATLCSLIDIAPTLCSYAGFSDIVNTDGLFLDGTDTHDSIYAEAVNHEDPDAPTDSLELMSVIYRDNLKTVTTSVLYS